MLTPITQGDVAMDIGKLFAEIEKSKAYGEGYHDGLLDIPKEDNPYDYSMWSDDYNNWNAGWWAGHMERDDPI